MNCGACCAAFRVSFYWAEADDGPNGWVPVSTTEPLTPTLRCMKGTNQKHPHCSQLLGDIPGGLCQIYEYRPSPCRELEPYDKDGSPTAQCSKARALYNLPPLKSINSSLL